jgi:deoxycytidine triphosphate deaminase
MVIPLIRGTTVTDHWDVFERAHGREGDLILIRNIDPEQLRDDDAHNSNVTYDLRVGARYRDHRDSQITQLTPEKDTISLPPSSAMIIETEEDVHLPKSRFAYIVPKVGLLQCGISNTPSKVDPGYAAPLLISVFNHGKRIVKLKRGQPFCAIIFHQVADGARLREKQEPRIQGTGQMGWWRRVRDSLERHSGFLSAVLLLISTVLAILYIVMIVRGK